MADVTVKVLEPAESYALLTLDEIKVALGIAPGDTSQDAQLQMMIDQYSKTIAEQGGFGLASAVKRQLLAAQEIRK